MSKPSHRPRRAHPLAVIGPGLLVAATGVGAGDLATAGFAGAHLGVAVLWAVLLGAFFKFVLNEGLARWQLATGQTLLEGAMLRLGPAVRWAFPLYLLPWSFFVGSALISACGATFHALAPDLIIDATRAKIVFGVIHSLAGLALVWLGGYRLFQRVMSACVALMFVTVIVTAAMICRDWPALALGLVWPTIPLHDGQGLSWTIALMGGVGGTLTVLCYGYWIREEGRAGQDALRTCRIDLGVGYGFTALFGVGMVVIAAGVPVTGTGVNLIVDLGQRLRAELGLVVQWLFLLGAWGAVFSSLLGVWQAVPYIFADFCTLTRDGPQRPVVDTTSLAYRVYLVALALVPMAGLFVSFKEVQKWYSIIGALFMPLLALTLLLLNGRGDWVGPMRNRRVTGCVLAAILLFFLVAGALEVYSRFTGGLTAGA